MQPISELSPVGRKPPAVGALTHPVTHSSSVHPQNLRGQSQPPHQVRSSQAKPQQPLSQRAKPLQVQAAQAKSQQPTRPQPGQSGQILPSLKLSDQNPPKLLDQVRGVLRTKHYSMRTEESYIDWIRRYILFHNKRGSNARLKWRHPAEMGEKEISEFLTHLAVNEHVAASTQNQALSAILFLYRHVLKQDIGQLGELTWAKKPETLPVVLSKVKKLHDADLKKGFGAVDLPFALDRKHTGLSREFNWQYVFPSKDISPNKISGHSQRHHTSERTAQRAFAKAVKKAGITKHVHPHTLRHSGVYPAPFAGPPTCWKRAATFGPFSP